MSSTRESISGLKLDTFSLKSLSTFNLFLHLFFKRKVEKARSHKKVVVKPIKRISGILARTVGSLAEHFLSDEASEAQYHAARGSVVGRGPWVGNRRNN